MLEILLEFYPKEESKRLLVDVSKQKFNFLVAKHLLEKGICNVDHVTEYIPGKSKIRTALLNAVVKKKKNVVEFLLAHGADPNLPTPQKNCWTFKSSQEVKELLRKFSERGTIWTSESHKFFPESFSERVFIFLCINKLRMESKVKIPKFVLFLIFEYASFHERGFSHVNFR